MAESLFLRSLRGAGLTNEQRQAPRLDNGPQRVTLCFVTMIRIVAYTAESQDTWALLLSIMNCSLERETNKKTGECFTHCPEIN